MNKVLVHIGSLSLLLLLSNIPEIYLFSRAYISLFLYICLILFLKFKHVSLTQVQLLVLVCICFDIIFNIYNSILVFYLLPLLVISNKAGYWETWHKTLIALNVLIFLSALPIYFGYSFDLPTEMLKKNSEGFVNVDFYSRSVLNALVITGDIHPVIGDFHLYRYCSIFMEPAIYGFISIPTISYILRNRYYNFLTIIYLVSLFFTFSITLFSITGILMLIKLNRQKILILIILAITLSIYFDLNSFFLYVVEKINGNSFSHGSKDFSLTFLEGSFNHSYGNSINSVSFFSLMFWAPVLLSGLSAPYLMIYAVKTLTHFVPNLLFLLWILRKRVSMKDLR